MAGFHIGVRGKAAGQIVRCAAREGACKLTGADGEPTPHFSSLADGEAYLAERENVSKGGFAPAINSKATTSDETAGVNYGKIAADAADIHDRTFEELETVIRNSEIIIANRSWFAERIVGPNGYIAVPENVDSDTRNKLLKQATDYFNAANEAESYLVASGKTLEGAIANSAALALTAEVHRLTHQEDEAGALLRDLREREIGLPITVRPYSVNIYSFAATDDVYASADKWALLDQVNDRLCAAMSHYDREAAELMLTRFFEKDADEWATPHSSHLLNVNDLPTVSDAESDNNMRASESKLCTYDTELTTGNYVEARERLSEAISRATKNMSSRIKNA